MRTLAAGLFAVLVSVSAVQADEVRGLWVVRTGLVSPEEIDRVVDEAAAGGFNTLLVQVRGRGDAFYKSRLVPRSPIIPARYAGFDPLAHLLERARARHLQVHAWMNLLLTGHFGQPLPEVLVRHPDWVMVPKSAARAALSIKGRARLSLVASASSRADVEGYYLSPFAPGVADHLEQVVRELLREYPVDGVHLDFIRYPSVDFDYSRAALESFQHAQGGGDLLSGPSRAPAAWDEHRRAAVTAIVERLAKAARQERPRIFLSAAVVPSDVEALNQKFQAWPTWMARGLLDAVCPMAYTPDKRLFRSQIEQAREYAGDGRHLWAGVGAYRLDIPTIVENIRAARRAGASGVVLFSHESLDHAGFQRLRKEAFGDTPSAVAAVSSPR